MKPIDIAAVLFIIVVIGAVVWLISLGIAGGGG